MSLISVPDPAASILMVVVKPFWSLDMMLHWFVSQADIMALDEALSQFALLYPRQSQVVELRFFGGLEVDEVAEALKISAVTVGRDWKFAKAWLLRAVGEK